MNLAEGKGRFSQKKLQHVFPMRSSQPQGKRTLCALRALVSGANGRETKNKLSQIDILWTDSQKGQF
jgi:hypothetical protein